MVATQFQFTKAARHAVKLKIGIDGPSGSGKTFGALSLAHGIAPGGRVALADSENGSAALYADRFAFDSLVIPNAEPATYKAIIDAAVEAKYDVLVIDSISHAWLKLLAEKEEYDRANPRTNQWTNWRIFGGKWDMLMAHILAAPIHIVATMRSKQAYEQVENAGSKKIVKLGLQPQVRDGAEYEFGIVFSVNQAHRAEATKDRTQLFADRTLDLADVKLHRELVGWMNAGGEAPAPAPRPKLVEEAPAPQQDAPAPEFATEDEKLKIRRLVATADLVDDKKRGILNALGKPLDTFTAAKWIRQLEAIQPKKPAESDPTPTSSTDSAPTTSATTPSGDAATGGKSDARKKRVGEAKAAIEMAGIAMELNKLLNSAEAVELLTQEERTELVDEAIKAATPGDLKMLLGEVDAQLEQRRKMKAADDRGGADDDEQEEIEL